jgi:hypothetical protein
MAKMEEILSATKCKPEEVSYFWSLSYSWLPFCSGTCTSSFGYVVGLYFMDFVIADHNSQALMYLPFQLCCHYYLVYIGCKLISLMNGNWDSHLKTKSTHFPYSNDVV